jgi:hypothetical protein
VKCECPRKLSERAKSRVSQQQQAHSDSLKARGGILVQLASKVHRKFAISLLRDLC